MSCVIPPSYLCPPVHPRPSFYLCPSVFLFFSSPVASCLHTVFLSARLLVRLSISSPTPVSCLPMLIVRLSSRPSDHLNIVHTLSPVLLPTVSLSYCSPVNLFTDVTIHLPRISVSVCVLPYHLSTQNISQFTLPFHLCPIPVLLSIYLSVFQSSTRLAFCLPVLL
jgi:hypothetical protein